MLLACILNYAHTDNESTVPFLLHVFYTQRAGGVTQFIFSLIQIDLRGFTADFALAVKRQNYDCALPPADFNRRKQLRFTTCGVKNAKDFR